jgi:DNA repair exonuclease SbcCD ATPase subunit
MQRVSARNTARHNRQLLFCVVMAGLLPGVAAAQRSDDRTQFDARVNVLQRSLTELSAQIEQLKARDHELQQQLQRMRGTYDQRLERLEKGAAPKAAPLRRSKP